VSLIQNDRDLFIESLTNLHPTVTMRLKGYFPSIFKSRPGYYKLLDVTRNGKCMSLAILAIHLHKQLTAGVWALGAVFWAP
jgi:hypothetical protein